jgi:hypothetical protein
MPRRYRGTQGPADHQARVRDDDIVIGLNLMRILQGETPDREHVRRGLTTIIYPLVTVIYPLVTAPRVGVFAVPAHLRAADLPKNLYLDRPRSRHPEYGEPVTRQT